MEINRVNVLKLLLFLLCNKMICLGNIIKLGNNLGILIEPYKVILNYYNITEKQNFTESVLQKLIQEFAQRIHCSREPSIGQDTETCTDSFCVNVPSLRVILGQEHDTLITEENFEEVTSILIGIAITFNESCPTDLVITNETVSIYRQDFVRMLKGTATTDALQLEAIQDTLEHISIGNTEEYNHDTDGEDENAADLLIKERCLGADILFDQLGLDVEENCSLDNIGQLSALTVLHILNGAEISRDCRRLPRDQFFSTELYTIYGTGNGVINKAGFTNLLDGLHIGGTHEHYVAEAGDVLDLGNISNRSLQYGDMLHKTTWETTCYTEEELLAIFHIYDNTIPVEQFNVICPALVQQKLAGVCADSGIDGTLKVKFVSIADKYGYGTIATFVTCLCSVVGAFVVKCTSDKAYHVIMALFMGLATGTLFTDAMIHLLPQAFGVHGHNETEDLDHDHESDGIVVEPFIWIALVACAGLYMFYLFEKILLMFRGKHAHSHGPGDQRNHFPNAEMHITVADNKYKENKPANDTEKQTQDKQSKPLPNIAIMVLMGDAVHNFADGLAIGAGFSSSITLGLSTSIAVFCHELPHELGDFAILLASGVSFSRALVLNMMVSATAMAGLYLGLVISDDESVRQWIVAITAGIFLYISLVDMMPQLLQRTDRELRDFILNNIGMLLGALAMFTVAIFEDKIRV